MCAFQRACERRGGRERHDVGISCSCKAPCGLCSSFYLAGNRSTVCEHGEFQNIFRTLPVVSPRPCAFCPFCLSQRRSGISFVSLNTTRLLAGEPGFAFCEHL